MHLYVHRKEDLQRLVRNQVESIPVVRSATPLDLHKYTDLIPVETVPTFFVMTTDYSLKTLLVISVKDNDIHHRSESKDQKGALKTLPVTDRMRKVASMFENQDLVSHSGPVFDTICKPQLVEFLTVVFLACVDTASGVDLTAVPHTPVPSDQDSFVVYELDLSRECAKVEFEHIPNSDEDGFVAFGASFATTQPTNG